MIWKGAFVMKLYSIGPDGSIEALPCGFMSCLVAEGLLAGTDRDEKRALRRAEQAERAFRAAKGYAPDGLWRRILYKIA